MGQHLEKNPAHYPSDEGRKRVSEFDNGRSLDNTTAGSYRHQRTQLEVSRYLLRKCRADAACIRLVLHARDVMVAMTKIIADIKAAGGELVTMTESTRFDETPLKLTVVDDVILQEFPDCFLGNRETEAALQEVKKSICVCFKDTAPTKVLQTQRMYGLLVKLEEKYSFITFVAVLPILAMERTTARNYSACSQMMDLLYPADALFTEFKRSQKLVCTDGDGAIARSERARASEFPGDVLRTVCNVHKKNTDKERVCGLCQETVKRLTHTVLSLGYMGTMRTFRKALMDCLQSRMEVIRTRPSFLTLQSNEKLLSATWPQRKSKLVQMRLLLSVCVGDFRDTRRVLVHASPGESDEAAKRRASAIAVGVLCAAAPKSFPTRGWIRSEEAPSWIGCMELTHGLFSAAYCMMCDRLAPRGAAGPPAGIGGAPPLAVEDREAVAALEDGLDLADGEDRDDGEDPGDGAAEVAAGAGGPAAAGAAAAAAVAGGEHGVGVAADDDAGMMDEVERRRRENAKFRETARTWCESGTVAADCISVYKLMEAHSALLARQLFAAGDEWEREQRVHECDAMTSGDADQSGLFALREYRLSRAYACVDEDILLNDVEKMMSNTEEWDAVDPVHRTRRLQSEIYCMLARTAVRSHTGKARHTNYPFKLFGLLKHPDLAAEIVEDAKCEKRMDGWSKSFVEHHGDLTSAETRMDLLATALLAKEETVHIEKQNSWLRRCVFSRSAQSKFLDLAGLNEFWCSKTSALERRGLWRPRMQGEGLAAGADTGIKGGGGRVRKRKISAWNVFTADRTSGATVCRRLSQAELSAEYKALSEADLARLKKRTKEANAAADDGVAEPLGKRPRLAHEARGQQQQGDGTLALALAQGSVPLSMPQSTALSIEEAQSFKSDLALLRQREESQIRAREEKAAKFSLPARFGDVGEAPADIIGSSVLAQRDRFSYPPHRVASFTHVEWRNVDLEARTQRATCTYTIGQGSGFVVRGMVLQFSDCGCRL